MLKGISAQPKDGEVWLDLLDVGQGLAAVIRIKNSEIDGIHFQILHPPPNYTAKKTNEHSCVLKVSATGGTILLPGDIEKRSERYLLKHANKQLNSDILIVPHHGSSTSSTAAFIDAINPKIALFAVGYRNRFGHPKPKVLEAYHERNITTWQTVNKGAISIRVLNDGISEVSFAR